MRPVVVILQTLLGLARGLLAPPAQVGVVGFSHIPVRVRLQFTRDPLPASRGLRATRGLLAAQPGPCGVAELGRDERILGLGRDRGQTALNAQEHHGLGQASRLLPGRLLLDDEVVVAVSLPEGLSKAVPAITLLRKQSTASSQRR
jgi:hypothetical protein